ncbi:putative endo-beta-1,4-glucanase D [Grifola frondosa]|uniref:AA9 family lytic polysaccharide monooxygenase n=1 Tax=Grifola frondosa TaxID=5627 RepID=A0A1C7M482_GRIFR|nr:putative endo-beta-1,4-glucanase D [Grifola frondosa]
MRTFASLLALSALVTGAFAHSIFQEMYVNGVDQGHITGIRVPDYDGPITDGTSNDLICNEGINPYHQPISQAIITVPAGAQVTAEWTILSLVLTLPILPILLTLVTRGLSLHILDQPLWNKYLLRCRCYFKAIAVNGVEQGHGVAVRVPSSNNPITDLTSDNIICNTGFIQPVSTAVASVPAGGIVSAEFHHTSAGYVGPDPSDPLDPTDKVPDATQTDVTGLQWFKVWERGLNPTTHQWGSDVLFINAGYANITIPSCVKAGQYLLRVEAISLAEATSYPGAQFSIEPGIVTNIYGESTYTPPACYDYKLTNPFYSTCTMSTFVSQLTYDLTQKVVPTTHSPSSPPGVQTITKQSLRSVFVDLNHPLSISAVRECLETLLKLEHDEQMLSANADEEEETLRRAILGKLTVALYAQAVQTFLDEASDAETELECIPIATLQSHPYHLEHRAEPRSAPAPVHFHTVFPSTAIPILQCASPNALTIALFPHLHFRPYSVGLTGVHLPSSSRSPRERVESAFNAFIASFSRLALYLSAVVTLPLELTRSECRYKRKELERIRDERAEVLGALADMRDMLGAALDARQNDEGVARLVQFTAMLQGLTEGERSTPEGTPTTGGMLDALTTLATCTLPSHASLHSAELNTGRLRRHASRSLGRVSCSSTARAVPITICIYEEDIKNPVKSAIQGTLLRSLFIQVQKAKVGGYQPGALRHRQVAQVTKLTFAFVGVAPALAIVYAFAGYVRNLWAGGKGRGRYGGKKAARASGDNAADRAPPHCAAHFGPLAPSPLARVRRGETTSSPPLTSGLLLLSVSHLRTYAEQYLPANSRIREGFLEDVADLEDPALGRAEKLRVLDRMWRSWGEALGWAACRRDQVWTLMMTFHRLGRYRTLGTGFCDGSV